MVSILQRAGSIAGASSGGVIGGLLGTIAASVIFAPVALFVVPVTTIGTILGMAKGSEMGIKHPEAAIGLAAVTAVTTGGLSSVFGLGGAEGISDIADSGNYSSDVSTAHNLDGNSTHNSEG